MSLKLIVLTPVLLFITGCSALNSPVSGLITATTHSGIGGDRIIDNNVQITKIGTATCRSVLGIIAFGDCSVATAKWSAGISKINSVHQQSFNIWTLYASHTTVIQGD
jgi:hypothetical protein